MILRSFAISGCENNPLCSQMPYNKCLQFDRVLYTKLIEYTKHTATQPAHATFLSRDYPVLNIPPLFLTKLQERTSELDI